MMKPDTLVHAASALRDQMNALAEEHERRDHGGERCGSNRASLIGYLAHCIGLTNAEVIEAATFKVKLYDANCCDRNCGHSEGD